MGDTLSTIAEALGVDLNVLSTWTRLRILTWFSETVLTTIELMTKKKWQEAEVYTPEEVDSDVASATAENPTK